MDGITITDEDGQVRVTIAGKYGPIQFTIGGDDAEFVHANGTWTYRSREYTGRIVFERGTLRPASGYQFMLKNDKDATASPAAFKAISAEVSTAVQNTLTDHPEILTRARMASAKRKLADAERRAAELAGQLAEARQAENQLRAKLGQPARKETDTTRRSREVAWSWSQNGSEWTCGAFTVRPYRQHGTELWEAVTDGHRVSGGWSGPFTAIKAAERLAAGDEDGVTADVNDGGEPDDERTASDAGPGQLTSAGQHWGANGTTLTS